MVVKASIEKQMTGIELATFFQQAQRVFWGKRQPANTALPGTIGTEKQTDGLQFHTILLLSGGSLVGHGMQHAPLIVVPQDHAHMGIDAGGVYRSYGMTDRTSSSSKDNVARLQGYRIWHLEESWGLFLMATGTNPYQANKKGRNRENPASTLLHRLTGINL